ncbi:repeat-containing 1-like [Octopus vulgaris]|uniref:Repeat-containing 1-like n=1 Tax=Octopus vulgaris TaxID=6645 RepID=A0AA36F7X3_OCTVU|nr:repeat-containing 1-like [Octopus vulgaris]
MISLDSLDSLKLFAVDPKQRSMLLQDKTLIDGLVLLLSNESETVIISTLEIFLLLSECPEGRTQLTENNYLQMQLEEALQSPNEDICNKAMKLYETLQNTPVVNPAKTNIYQTPKTNRRSNLPKTDHSSSSHNGKYKTILFQLKGLFDKHDRELCTCLLIKVKGVISIIFDMNKSRCTVRTLSKIQPEVLAEAIAKSQTMSAQQIVKNELGEEVLLPCSSDQANVSTDGPDYLDDVESPLADDKAVCRTESSNNRFNSGSWLRTAANYFSNSFW